MKTPYDILGVSKTADLAEIKAAYRKLAREFHPDRHPGKKEIAEKFRDINDAYRLLSNPEERRKYDELSARPPQERRRPTSAGHGETARDDFSEAFSRFVDELFPDMMKDMPHDEGDFMNFMRSTIVAGMAMSAARNAAQKRPRGTDGQAGAPKGSVKARTNASGDHSPGRASSSKGKGGDSQTVEISFQDALFGCVVSVPGNAPLRLRLPQRVLDGQMVKLPRRSSSPEMTVKVRVRASHYLSWRESHVLVYNMPISVEEMRGNQRIDWMCPVRRARADEPIFPEVMGCGYRSAFDVRATHTVYVGAGSDRIALVVRPLLMLDEQATPEVCLELRKSIAGGIRPLAPIVRRFYLDDLD